MPTSNKAYIPEDLSKAPEYHLAQNIAKELPEIDPDSSRGKYLDSLAAISAVQVFEEIPGIQKSIISLDSINSFEIWEMIPHRVLLPSDVEFLKQDNNRVEAIAKKLIWLGESWLSSEILDKKIRVKTWEDVLEKVYEYRYDLITIGAHPGKISLETHKSQAQEVSDFWSVYPPSWNIRLTKLRGLNGCYIIDYYNSSYSFVVEVWAGIPFYKNIQTGEVITLNEPAANP